MISLNSNRENQRYRVDQISAKSLKGNPLDSPVKRDLAIYLPPRYFEVKKERYSTVYLLQRALRIVECERALSITCYLIYFIC